MPNVKIKNYVGDDCIYEDVDKVWLASEDSTDDNPVLLPYTYGEALDGVEVEPDFSGGDMQVTVPEGYLLRSGVLKKPENLIPGNIKKGETIAGIPGEYEGETVELEAVTVALAMADGDQVIEPTEGKALGKVTLTKPETLVPENIAEGVDIAGIIGTLAAGGTDLPFNIWTKTITGVQLSASSSASYMELATADELPEWADLENIKTISTFGNSSTSSGPIYILGLFLRTGHSSYGVSTYNFFANIVTNLVEKSGSTRYMGCWVGQNVLANLSSNKWFETVTANYMGICVQNGGISQRSYNGYGGLNSQNTYQLILIKIDPM